MTGGFPGLSASEEQLFKAARSGDLATVDTLLNQGVNPNARESGDNTYAMHWAAAAGHLAVVRRLADAGGDVVGHGDDHELEVIGWATSWEGCNDDAHRQVAEFLVSRGARHHIFSAIAMDLEDEVRRIVAGDPGALNRRQSRNEAHRLPLHFAVVMDRPRMVTLLLELGADPLAVDALGQTASHFARNPTIDRPIMERIRALLAGELLSAARGNRQPRTAPMDLAAVVALGEWDMAGELARRNPALVEAKAGVLHLMAQRNDLDAVQWLLQHGADVNGRWNSLGAEVPALHLAAARGHVEMVRLLLAAGADPRIRDSMHDGDAIGWAEYFQQPAVVELLRTYSASRGGASLP